MKATIALADDHVLLRKGLANLLKELDYEVLFEADNGQLFLEKLKNNQAPQITLMDINMPVMDGYTAVKEIKASYPHLPVLAFTAALIDHDMLASLKASGFEEALLKPFQPMALFAKIRSYLNVETSSLAQDAA